LISKTDKCLAFGYLLEERHQIKNFAKQYPLFASYKTQTAVGLVWLQNIMNIDSNSGDVSNNSI
jgi:hypothetical protein